MLLAQFDATTAAQLTVNGVIRGAIYGLLGVGFALILGVTGRFHFAYSFTYAFAAYMSFTFLFRGPKLPFWISAVLGVLCATAAGLVIERFIYRSIVKRAGATALLAVFVAALGIGIAGQNMLALFWGQATLAYYGPTKKGWSLGSTTFENFDVWQVVSSTIFVLILAALLRYTGLGRAIKATRVNPDLATIIGINANVIYLVCFGIGSFLAGVAAFLSGLATDFRCSVTSTRSRRMSTRVWSTRASPKSREPAPYRTYRARAKAGCLRAGRISRAIGALGMIIRRDCAGEVDLWPRVRCLAA